MFCFALFYFPRGRCFILRIFTSCEGDVLTSILLPTGEMFLCDACVLLPKREMFYCLRVLLPEGEMFYRLANFTPTRCVWEMFYLATFAFPLWWVVFNLMTFPLQVKWFLDSDIFPLLDKVVFGHWLFHFWTKWFFLQVFSSSLGGVVFPSAAAFEDSWLRGESAATATNDPNCVRGCTTTINDFVKSELRGSVLNVMRISCIP